MRIAGGQAQGEQMLTGEKIAELELLSNTNADNFRGASYDVRAGKIIKPGGKVVSQFLIPPQGIVEVISKETVKLPNNICGFAAVKTDLSTQGLLALNIGIIDPLYEGPIASFLLNFSKADIFLDEDDVFLRTYFVELPSATTKAKEVIVSPEQYVKDKRKRSARFGTTFLNIDKIVSDIAKDYAWRALVFVGVLALVVTFSSYLASTLSVRILPGWVDPAASIRADVKKSQGDAAAARAETVELQQEIAKLRACVQQSRTSQAQARVRC
jgi:dUTPase